MKLIFMLIISLLFISSTSISDLLQIDNDPTFVSENEDIYNISLNSVFSSGLIVYGNGQILSDGDDICIGAISANSSAYGNVTSIIDASFECPTFNCLNLYLFSERPVSSTPYAIPLLSINSYSNLLSNYNTKPTYCNYISGTPGGNENASYTINANYTSTGGGPSRGEHPANFGMHCKGTSKLFVNSCAASRFSGLAPEICKGSITLLASLIPNT